MPIVARAASTGKVADVNTLKLLFDRIGATVPAPDHAKAMAGLARVESMIAAGSDAPSTFQQDIPDDVKPFAVSRLEWGKTRGTMREQLGVLQAAIVATCKAAGGLDAVTADVGRLFDYVLKLDDRLEAKLDQIVSSPAGDTRMRSRPRLGRCSPNTRPNSRNPSSRTSTQRMALPTSRSPRPLAPRWPKSHAFWPTDRLHVTDLGSGCRGPRHATVPSDSLPRHSPSRPGLLPRQCGTTVAPTRSRNPAAGRAFPQAGRG